MKKIILTVTGMILSGTIFAANNIGVVDIHQIMMNMPQVKQEQNKLKNQFAPDQKKLMAQQKIVQDNLAKYKKDSSVMTNKDKKSLQSKIMSEQQKLQTMQMTFQKQAMSAQKQSMGKIVAKISDAVKAVAVKNHYNLVLTTAGVAYNADNIDITKQVIAKLK
ncbi:MAG: OmpH family outer membrane protein [Gammaproteobacteria bacterium]|nr:OmpH family outer membrane protein [Gammaproteobacteria bacterium]